MAAEARTADTADLFVEDEEFWANEPETVDLWCTASPCAWLTCEWASIALTELGVTASKGSVVFPSHNIRSEICARLSMQDASNASRQALERSSSGCSSTAMGDLNSSDGEVKRRDRKTKSSDKRKVADTHNDHDENMKRQKRREKKEEKEKKREKRRRKDKKR
eukprot:scaffold105999_cov32-Tisochrysis_lutea.AAC.1